MIHITDYFMRISHKIKTELNHQKPVIIMGRGHSGTRILSSVCEKLGLNMGINGDAVTGDVSNRKFQRKIIQIAFSSITDNGRIVSNEKNHEKFNKALWDYYLSIGKPDNMWGWKFPETYLIAPYVFQCFPKAKFIHIIRDGRDISFKKHLTDDPQKRLGKRILNVMNALNLPHHKQAALSWDFQVKSFDYWRKKYSSVEILDIRFEDLCSESLQVGNQIADYLGKNLNDKVITFLNNEINTRKIKQYKDNDFSKIDEVQHLIHDTLSKYKYI